MMECSVPSKLDVKVSHVGHPHNCHSQYIQSENDFRGILVQYQHEACYAFLNILQDHDVSETYKKVLVNCVMMRGGLHQRLFGEEEFSK